MSHRSISAFVLCFSVAGVFVGCSASGDSAPDLSIDPSSNEPGSTLPPSSGNGGSSGGGGKTDGGPKPEAGSDASVDAGPPPPVPGTSCAKPDEIFARPCGACGTQQAICLKNDPSDATGKVSDYSACSSELEGGCVPGTVVDEACGNCGTHKKTCTKYCSFTTTACVGEPAGSCSAGTVLWTNAGCGAGTFRDRECSAMCQWGSFQGCTSPDFSVAVRSGLGGITSVIVPLSTASLGKRVTGSCTSAAGATVSTTDKHTVTFVRVENPNAQNARVSVWNAQAPGGATINTVLVGYASQPASDDALRACEVGAGDYCSTATVPCGDSKFGALTGPTALVIPAGGSRVVAMTSYYPQGTAGETIEGPVVLGVRTDALE